jgi:hypothetical protein
MIKKITEEVFEPKDDEEVKKILGQTEKAEEKEDETDIMDDYDEGMDEFTESLGGKKEKKTSEIRALG